MLKIRVIPVLFLMNGLIVRSERFSEFKVIGNPLSELERYSEWLADELVYADITREGEHDLRRDDHKVKNAGGKLEILRSIARKAFMPLTFGGRLGSLDEIDSCILNGADKVLVNTIAWKDPTLLRRASARHGSQAIVVGIDVKRSGDDVGVYIDQGRTRVSSDPVGWARKVEADGAGEILLNSIDRDGCAEGYDIAILRAVADAVSIPVVACGGVGDFSDFRPAIDEAKAAAVAAGNIFHFTENSYKRAKQYLSSRGYAVRYPYDSGDSK